MVPPNETFFKVYIRGQFVTGAAALRPTTTESLPSTENKTEKILPTGSQVPESSDSRIADIWNRRTTQGRLMNGNINDFSSPKKINKKEESTKKLATT